ncbi:uncharacterized protein MONBRDRAFT_3541, partial [Monosiga brevicollis MX1]
CPEDYLSLGNKSWAFLHTMAAYFPRDPSAADRKDMAEMMRLVGRFYPCRDCGEHLGHYIEAHPVDASSGPAFARWLCGAHNDVNERLGKPIFDCDQVEERWHTGWKDGSCD